jgi:mono/diheme cytochrome c family protein
LKKPYSKLALGLIALIIVFAIASFLRENWGVTGAPGVLERMIAKWALGSSRRGDSGTRNPVAPTAQNLEEGRVSYEKQCAFCHGLDGRGQAQQSGVQFYPPVPAIAGPTVDLTDGQIQSTITNGIRYTGMPSFSKVLSPEEVWKVVLWVRHISQSTPPPQSGAPGGAGSGASAGPAPSADAHSKP